MGARTIANCGLPIADFVLRELSLKDQRPKAPGPEIKDQRPKTKDQRPKTKDLFPLKFFPDELHQILNLRLSEFILKPRHLLLAFINLRDEFVVSVL